MAFFNVVQLIIIILIIIIIVAIVFDSILRNKNKTLLSAIREEQKDTDESLDRALSILK